MTERPILPPHGKPPLADRKPCRRCSDPTPIATLQKYGARCFGCYQRYLAGEPAKAAA